MGPVRVGRAAAIAATGAVLGLLWNAASGRGFDLSHSAFVQAGDEVLSAAEAFSRHRRGALFLDARPAAFFEMSHIPGALSLPEDDFDAAFARLEARLRRTYDIVVYCAGFGCEASHIVARKLRDRDVHAAVLEDGWPAWTDAGYPVTEASPR
jgi:rhodanese-related sulfurtransferase